MRKKLLSLSAALGLALVAAVPLANAQSSFTFSSSNPVETTTVTATPAPPTTTPPTTTTPPPTEPTTPPTTTTPPPTEPTEPTTPAPSVTITNFEANSSPIEGGNGVNIDLTWDSQGGPVDRFEVTVATLEDAKLGSFECSDGSKIGTLDVAGDRHSTSMTSPSRINHGFCLEALGQDGSVLASAATEEAGLVSTFPPSMKPTISIETYPGNLHHSYVYAGSPFDFCYDGTFIFHCLQVGAEMQLSPDPSFPLDNPDTQSIPGYQGLDLPGVTGCNYVRLRYIDPEGNHSQWSNTETYLWGHRLHTQDVTCD